MKGKLLIPYLGRKILMIFFSEIIHRTYVMSETSVYKKQLKLKSLNGIPIIDFLCTVKSSYQTSRLRLTEQEFQDLYKLAEVLQGFDQPHWTPFTAEGAILTTKTIMYIMKAPKYSGSAFGMDTFSI